MAITYAPFGLRQNRPATGSAPNFMANIKTIKKSYASAIGFGDPVISLTGGNAGYIGPYAEAGTHILGVFIGLLPYFDTGLQQYVNKNYYLGTELASADLPCYVIDDPFQTFIIQVNGGPITQASIGLNADIGGAGNPSTSGGSVGASVAYLDFSTVATTATLPLRIVNIANVAIGGTDPTIPSSQLVANNYAEVRFNTSEFLQTTGY